MKNPSNRQWRWIQFLSQFIKEINYIKGSENVVADFLSRHQEEEHTEELSHITLKELIEDQKKDPSIQNIPHSSLIIDRNKDGLLVDKSTKIPRILLPECHRYAEFSRLHNLGHGGANTTIKLLTKRYVWPYMKSEIRKCVRNCQNCQANKITRHTKSPSGIITNREKLRVVHIDLVGPLKEIRGKKFLFTMIDHDTGWVEAFPMWDIGAKEVTDIIEKEWISRFGTPEQIISDNGRQFISTDFRNLCNRYGIEHHHTTPYHLQSNGKIERLHRTLKEVLRSGSTNEDKEWIQTLPLVLLGLRNKINDSGLSPSQILFGTSTRLPGDVIIPSSNQSIVDVPDFSHEFRNPCDKKSFLPKDLFNCKLV